MAASGERYPYDPPIPSFEETDPYELAVRSQAGAEEILSKLGALEEIRQAALGHCEEHRPEPPYKPQLLKERLKQHGWIPEVRVPPFSPEHDGKSINERYDMLKFFETRSGEVGVAIEMDNWMVHRDLLKFRRGFERGQIAAGVVIQPDYYDTHYCYEHFLALNEPLFGEIPVVYCCPRGPGLREPPVRSRKYGPFLMPNEKASPTT
jgi:hypothetical protein